MLRNVEVNYKDLNVRANQVAQLLLNRGVRLEDIVGVCLERSSDLVAVLLGILKAGAAYLPLDAAYPAERLEMMVTDARPKFVVAQKSTAAGLPASALLILLDAEDVSSELAQSTENNPAQHERSGALHPEHAAYVIYTSGSTGKPKGTVIQHRSAVEMVTWAREKYSEEELERVLASTSSAIKEVTTRKGKACLHRSDQG
jgi:microcystin synthetase protein McyA